MNVMYKPRNFKDRQTFRTWIFSFAKKAVISQFFISIGFSILSETYANGISSSGHQRKCKDLLVGQYLCDGPEIDPETQQAQGCTEQSRNVSVWCKLSSDVECDGMFENGTFQKTVPCNWTKGCSFETALLLSIFLGMFGVDRFYLGYPAMGLVKFATLGFMFLGQLIDILLIATQVLLPADGSSYIMDYYGAATERIVRDNDTYLMSGD